MKKYIQFLVVLVLVLTVVGVARNSPVWAGSLPTSKQPSGAIQPNSVIIITGSGSYTVGGLCVIDVVYKGKELRDQVGVDVPAEVSRKIPFSYPDQLYLAGCHVVHYKQDKITREMSANDGSWKVCFGDRPDEKLTIYYYLDDSVPGSAVWLPLPTTVKDGYACAPAVYTGVYAPGGILIRQPGSTNMGGAQPAESRSGTVRPPSSSVTITKSGTYTVGGVCSIIIKYYISGLSNEVHVEKQVEVSANVPFPDNEGLLYLPGCHVFHYKSGNLVDEVTTDEGSWMICFAAVPDKKTTIYFYSAEDDINPVKSDWTPLETTVANGSACAPLTDFTGVYAPAGK